LLETGAEPYHEQQGTLPDGREARIVEYTLQESPIDEMTCHIGLRIMFALDRVEEETEWWTYVSFHFFPLTLAPVKS